MKAARELEGLSQDNETIGTIDDPLEIREEGIRFALSLAGGPKTGFFFYHRDNRSRLARYVQGRSVLDVFTYVGAWALRALRDGAASAVCLDSSQPALVVAISEEHTSELQSLMRTPYAVFCLKKKKTTN